MYLILKITDCRCLGRGIRNNPMLILAVLGSASLMFITMFIPALRDVFGLAVLSVEHVIQLVVLIFSPLVIVEIMKFFKINGEG